MTAPLTERCVVTTKKVHFSGENAKCGVGTVVAK
jgi:hypothetical protein